MKILLTSVTICLLLFTYISCDDSSDDTAIEEEPIVILEELTAINVSYGSNDSQVYDMYLPADRSSSYTKTMILIHGGGWTEGDKANIDDLVSLIQATHPDHAIINMNYILADPPIIPAFPNQFLDVQAVINQLNERGEELGITQEYGLLGASAGAHLAMMYDYVYDTEDQVKFVANIVGSTDFTDPFYTEDPTNLLLAIAFTDETAYPEDVNLLELLSPALVVTESASPTLQFYGNQDPLVPLSNGQRLDVALGNAGIPHIFTVYDGGHGNWDTVSYLDVQNKIGQYIDLYLAID